MCPTDTLSKILYASLDWNKERKLFIDKNLQVIIPVKTPKSFSENQSTHQEVPPYITAVIKANSVWQH